MDHVKAIAIKFVIIAIVLYSILGIFSNASVGNILIVSLLVTGISYIIGDLFILRKFGNLVATIADFGLAFLSVWALGELLFVQEFGLVSASLFIAVLMSCSEAVFHIYMQNKVFHDDEEIYIKRSNLTRDLQTEYGEENPDQDYISLRNKNKKG